MTTIIPKVVKTRDAATSILRKLGLKPNMYGLFIRKVDNDIFEVDLPKVYAQGYAVHVTTGKAPKLPKAKVEKLVKSPKPAKSPKAPKETAPRKERSASCSSVARELILAGKTNEEVWTVIKAQFKLSDDKRHYPTWYRCQLKRAGKLIAEK